MTDEQWLESEAIDEQIDKLMEDPAYAPLVVRNLVSHAPAEDELPFIGTTILEDLDMKGEVDIAEMVRRSGITSAQAEKVLSGWIPQRG